MGDAPMAFVETTGGVRVAEDDSVTVGKNDVSRISPNLKCLLILESRFFLSRLVERSQKSYNRKELHEVLLVIV